MLFCHLLSVSGLLLWRDIRSAELDLHCRITRNRWQDWDVLSSEAQLLLVCDTRCNIQNLCILGNSIYIHIPYNSCYNRVICLNSPNLLQFCNGDGMLSVRLGLIF
jgi:hypothetical protein